MWRTVNCELEYHQLGALTSCSGNGAKSQTVVGGQVSCVSPNQDKNNQNHFLWGHILAGATKKYVAEKANNTIFLNYIQKDDVLNPPPSRPQKDGGSAR